MKPCTPVPGIKQTDSPLVSAKSGQQNPAMTMHAGEDTTGTTYRISDQQPRRTNKEVDSTTYRKSFAVKTHADKKDGTTYRPCDQRGAPPLALDDAHFPGSSGEALLAAGAFIAAALLLIAGMGGVVFAAMALNAAEIWQLVIWVMVSLFSMPLALWALAVCTSMMVLALEDGEAR